MNQKTTIGLLIALILAVGYVLCYQKGWLGLGPRTAPESQVGKDLIAKPPANTNVRRVELTAGGRDKIVAVYADSAWQILEPVQARGDGPAVEKLVDAVKRLKISRVYAPDSKDTPAADLTGLDKPRATILIEDKDGGRVELTVGGRDSLKKENVYIRVGGDKNVYVVDSDPMDDLNVTAAALRDKDLWRFTKDKVARMTIAGPQGTLTADQTSAAVWQIAQPVKAPANDMKVSDLLNNVMGLKAVEWTGQAGDLAAYGLSSPKLTVELKVETEAARPATTQPEVRPATPAKYEVRRIVFGGEARDETYARLDDGPVFTVSSSKVKELKEVKLDELRDKRLAGALDRGGEVGLELAVPGKPATRLLKDASGVWRLTAPVEAKADNQAVEDFLKKLREMKAESFEDNPSAVARAAIDRPQQTVTVQRTEELGDVTVVVGAASPTGAMVYLRNEAYPSVAVAAAKDAKDLLVDPMSLADRTVWTLSADAVERIARSASGAAVPARAVARKADDRTTWQLVEPVKADAEADPIKNLLGKLSPLKAKRRTMLAPADVGLDKPAVTLTVTALEEQAADAAPTTQPAEPKKVERVRTLVLVEKDAKVFGQARLAGEAQPGPVFEFDPELLSDASGEWAARKLIGEITDADKAVALTIRSPEGQVELTRGVQGWVLEKDLAVPIDKERVEEVIKNLGDLTVSRYVAFGATADQLKTFGLDNPETRVEVRWGGESGRRVELLVSFKGEPPGAYATASDGPAASAVGGKVGLLGPADRPKVQKAWSFFQK